MTTRCSVRTENGFVYVNDHAFTGDSVRISNERIYVDGRYVGKLDELDRVVPPTPEKDTPRKGATPNDVNRAIVICVCLGTAAFVAAPMPYCFIVAPLAGVCIRPVADALARIRA